LADSSTLFLIAMRALRILLGHRVARWLRDPSWGTGTIGGQIVLLALLLFLLFPLGLGSYVLGDVLRELYPDAGALRLINGGMLYLVPVLTASRFLLQSPPSERVAPYVALPILVLGVLWGSTVRPGAASPNGAICWALGALLTVVLCSV
jgi:hypothetical protein